jgi:MFS family permease
MVFEVPSGAWADATSRRRLLIVAPLVTAIAFALWVTHPSFWAFALGFMLWGLKSALTSGALEALVYAELQRIDATEEYSTLMVRGQSAGVLAAICSGLVAAPVFSAFGFDRVGAGSVALSSWPRSSQRYCLRTEFGLPLTATHPAGRRHCPAVFATRGGRQGSPRR